MKVRGIAIAAIAAVLVLTVPARAQEPPDTLTRVRTLYESADYEQALQLLSTLRGAAASAEAASYQVFCLVALGRADEARAVVARIVRADPMFHPPSNQVSPRIRELFDDVRKPILVDVARDAYIAAKSAYERKDWPAARDGFARVAVVLDELNSSDASLADMKTVATGFRDLAAAAIAADAAAAAAAATPTPTPAPAPAPTPTAPPEMTSSPASTPVPVVYDDSNADVIRPIVVTRSMPPWRPSALELPLTFNGTLELIVGEDGKVISTSLLKRVHPRYDASLLEAAKSWTFQPATRNGTPVRYRYVMAISLTGPIK